MATSTGSHVAGSIFASARALRMARTRSSTASTSDSTIPSRPRSPGQRAWMSIGGSDARCGSASQIASVTKGISGWSRRRYVSSASTRAHHVATRDSCGSDTSIRRTLASSIPESQNSLQMASYRMRAASPKP